MNTTYHVMLGKRRTTVTLDKYLSDVLSIKLGQLPETAEAHAAVRQWLQKRLDDSHDPGRIRVSQWLQAEAIEFLLPPDLRAAYGDWILRDGSLSSGMLDKYISKKAGKE